MRSRTRRPARGQLLLPFVFWLVGGRRRAFILPPRPPGSPVYIPTPAQSGEECEKIRAEWSDYKIRTRARQPLYWQPPQARQARPE